MECPAPVCSDVPVNRARPSVLQHLPEPNRRRYTARTGECPFASSDYAGAEQAFRQALAIDATSAEAHYNLAVTLDRMGNKAEAKRHYIQAANLAPEQGDLGFTAPCTNQRSQPRYQQEIALGSVESWILE